jgi:hypothetical protein
VKKLIAAAGGSCDHETEAAVPGTSYHPDPVGALDRRGRRDRRTAAGGSDS